MYNKVRVRTSIYNNLNIIKSIYNFGGCLYPQTPPPSKYGLGGVMMFNLRLIEHDTSYIMVLLIGSIKTHSHLKTYCIIDVKTRLEPVRLKNITLAFEYTCVY